MRGGGEMPSGFRIGLPALLAGAFIVWASPGAAQDGVDLSALTLEELSQIDIESVSLRAEPLARAAASVFVINHEDIRRSGATSLPEVLRLAPTLQVQRVNAGDYAISARGFNGFETARHVLVLIDGRSIYTTLHSGVLWDAQGLILEDIERIDVISGPGGATYGSNAVNAVIRITTRSASRTQGPAAAITGGDKERLVSLRQGFGGEGWAARVFLQDVERDQTETPAGAPSGDEQNGVRGGFRGDWELGQDTVTADGLYYDGEAGPADLAGGHFLVRWTRVGPRGGSLSAQAFFDATERVNAGVEEVVKTTDLAFQHTFSQRGRHSLVWGAGFREIDNRLVAPPGSFAFLSPERRRITLFNLYGQDQIALSPDVILTLGLKLEENSFTGSEVLPNVRFGWTRPGGGLFWGAVSRAARTPSRIDRDLQFAGFLVSSKFESEDLTAYELGYRGSPHENLTYALTLFYHDYSDIRTVGPVAPGSAVFAFRNDAEGETWGMEAWGAYEVRDGWRITLGASALDKDFRLLPGAVDITGIASKGADSEYQVLFGSQSRLGRRLELDLRLRAVGELAGTGVEAYVAGEVRLGWQVREGVEFEVVGSNLLDGRHIESADPGRARIFTPAVHATLRAGF